MSDCLRLQRASVEFVLVGAHARPSCVERPDCRNDSTSARLPGLTPSTGGPGFRHLLTSAIVARFRSLFPTFTVLVVLAVGARLPSARAQTDDYRDTINAAIAEHASGNWEEALALFRQAHALRPSARTLRGMGVASFEARHYADAIRYLTAAATETARPLTPEQLLAVEQLIPRARAFVSRLSIVVSPADATVAVDGNLFEGDMRREILLDAGEHQLVVSASGYESSVRAVQLSPGTAANLDIDLSPKRDASALEGTSAAPPAHTAPPAHAATISESHSSADTPPRARFRRLKYSALGATVAGLVLTGVSAWAREQRAQSLQQDGCQSYLPGSTMEQDCEGLYEQANSWRRATIASAAVSGALLSTTLLLFALDSSVESPTAQLLRACQVEAAPLHVRCAASF